MTAEVSDEKSQVYFYDFVYCGMLRYHVGRKLIPSQMDVTLDCTFILLNRLYYIHFKNVFKYNNSSYRILCFLNITWELHKDAT